MRAVIAGGQLSQRRRVGGAMRRLGQKLQGVVLGRGKRGIWMTRGPLDLVASVRLCLVLTIGESDFF
jgi:hypothetical protein